MIIIFFDNCDCKKLTPLLNRDDQITQKQVRQPKHLSTSLKSECKVTKNPIELHIFSEKKRPDATLAPGRKLKSVILSIISQLSLLV